MSISDMFSRRRRTNQPQPSTLTYDLPIRLRGQVMHILMRAIGPVHRDRMYSADLPSHRYWRLVFDTVCTEYGVFQLADSHEPGDQCLDCVAGGPVEMALDVIELCLRARTNIDNPSERTSLPDAWHTSHWYSASTDLTGAEAVADFNARCEENAVGYRFIEGRIIEVGSEYTHSQMVEPTLTLLREEAFEGAHAEFLQAHKHLRAGDHKAAITEACKAFESTMKTICQRKGWTKSKNGEAVDKLTAAPLVQLLKEKAYFPNYLDNAMSGLVNLLTAGVGTVRNRQAAHGQGVSVIEADRELAEFAVHQAAANMLFLAKLLTPRS